MHRLSQLHDMTTATTTSSTTTTRHDPFLAQFQRALPLDTQTLACLSCPHFHVHGGSRLLFEVVTVLVAALNYCITVPWIAICCHHLCDIHSALLPAYAANKRT
eukprot:2318737-Amphidinium_carterae.2